MTDKTKILINCGPSKFGWHRSELFRRCPRLFAYVKLLNVPFPPSDPLMRGSLVHVGLAHHYARLKAVQEHTDPEAYYTPQEAMRLAATLLDAEFKTDRASALLQTYIDVPRDYAIAYPNEPVRVIAVEQLVTADVRGHPFTQRIDLVVEGTDKKVYFVDHKSAASIDKRTVARYSLSGQFLAMQTFGTKMYGDRFGGVRINFISHAKSPFRFERKFPEPAPVMLAQFPENYVHTEQGIAALASAGIDPWSYPQTSSDLVCVHSYGRCAGYELCRWGKEGLESSLAIGADDSW